MSHNFTICGLYWLKKLERKCGPIANLEGSMLEYEIRVLSSGHAIAVLEEMHLSNHAAVHSASRLAGNLPFEVWCGTDCIYESPSTPRGQWHEHSSS